MKRTTASRASFCPFGLSSTGYCAIYRFRCWCSRWRRSGRSFERGFWRTYSSSSFSPATQALTTALASDLCARHVLLYTSASTINLPTASQIVSQKIIDLQQINADMQAQTNVSTTLPTAPDAVKNDSDLQKTLDEITQQVKTVSSKITSDAAVANQLLSTFLSWQAGSDGNGGIIMTDVIRAEMLNEAMSEGMPALQVNIDAAGGNTRTNNNFFLNLFYTPSRRSMRGLWLPTN